MAGQIRKEEHCTSEWQKRSLATRSSPYLPINIYIWSSMSNHVLHSLEIVALGNSGGRLSISFLKFKFARKKDKQKFLAQLRFLSKSSGWSSSPFHWWYDHIYLNPQHMSKKLVENSVALTTTFCVKIWTETKIFTKSPEALNELQKHFSRFTLKSKFGPLNGINYAKDGT